MTISEAIRVLRVYKGETVDGIERARHGFDLNDETVDLAIRALEAWEQLKRDLEWLARPRVENDQIRMVLARALSMMEDE